MGKLVNSTYITLDGVVEDPHLWPSTGDDGGESDAIQAELVDTKALANGLAILSDRVC